MKVPLTFRPKRRPVAKWFPMGAALLLAGLQAVHADTYVSGTYTWSNNGTVSGDLVVATSGTAMIKVTANTTNVDGNTYLGNYAGSLGTIQVSGGTLGTGDVTYVGVNGVGVLKITGGTVTTGSLWIGSNATGSGTVTLSSGTLKSDQSDTIVGNSGTGTFTQSGGYYSSVAYLQIGKNSTGIGFATLTGGTSVIAKSINVGVAGTGSLTVSGSSTVKVGSGTVALGVNSGGVGTLNLGDGGSFTGVLSASTGNLMVTTGSGSGTVNFNTSNAKSYGYIFAGNLKLNQIGSGTTTLTATNTYTGVTTVSAGELKVNGSLSKTGTVTVTSGGRLSGSGTVGNIQVEGGTLAPGNSPGTITLTSLTLDAASTLEMQITGTTAGSFDQVQASDYVSLSGTLALTGLDAITALGASITLIEIDGTAVAKVVGQFTAVTVSGTSVLLSQSGATTTFTSGDVTYEIDTNGGDGNDVTLTVVPEPSTWLLAVGGLGLLHLVRRRAGQR